MQVDSKLKIKWMDIFVCLKTILNFRGFLLYVFVLLHCKGVFFCLFTFLIFLKLLLFKKMNIVNKQRKWWSVSMDKLYLWKQASLTIAGISKKS